jgi:TRAP-type mannitol/chloroaromatic compound transport system substrate-binding protein
MGDYGRMLTRLKQQGKDNSHEEYKVVLENYMRHSCAQMCERYEGKASSLLVDMKGILMLLKVLPSVLLDELYKEVLLACTEEPVAISQSCSQVFMHEIPGHVIGQVGVGAGVGGEGVCKLLNIFL